MIRALCRLSFLVLTASVVVACGGGGGGGSGGSSGGDGSQPGTPSTSFFLNSAALARPIFGPSGGLVSSTPLVNPASLQEIDPLTGVSLPGFPKPLNVGTSLLDLSTINLDQILDSLTPQVPLVPRNAALVLNFTKSIDPATLNLDDSDPAQPGRITSASAVQVRNKAGALIPARAFVLDTRIAIVGVTSSSLGFPGSPLVFDQMGTAIEDPTGFLRIVMNTGVFAALDGEAFSHRTDMIGSAAQPLPFNPGNAFLDAILLQTEAGAEGFNGFLPDLAPPRLVRPVTLDGTITGLSTAATPDGLAAQVEDSGLIVLPNITANNGLGEWASSLLTVTSAGGVTTSVPVETNFNVGATAVFRLLSGETLPPAVSLGDSYSIFRTEFFEPIPGPLPTDPDELARVTVDPVAAPRDPNDPQDAFNSDLRYFVRVFDETGEVERTDTWNPATGTFLAVDPKSSLQLQFSEPMDEVSFLPYETLYVTEGDVPRADPAFDDMRLGRISTISEGSVVRFRPALLDQLANDGAGGETFVGFGGSAASLSLVLRTVPDASTVSALKDSLSAENLPKLKDLDTLGVRGITDLGGRGLALPLALLDEGDVSNFLLSESSPGFGAFAPAIDFRVDFQTIPTEDPDYGVVVHRFLGQATSALFSPPDTGELTDAVTEGIEYNDFPPIIDESGTVVRRFIYGPRLLEVGLGVPGRLTGAPATTIEHLIDDFNPPAQGSISNPDNDDFLISLGFGLSMPLNSPFGARFQHIFRATDASPSKTDFLGVTLDLIGLAWTPFDNSVTNTTLDGMSVVVGLGGSNNGRGPNTNSSGGIPASINSGLDRSFDCNWLEYTELCQRCDGGLVIDQLAPFVEEQPPFTPVVKRGTPYSMMSANLFKPSSAGTQASGFNLYLDFPTFNSGIDPFFDREDIFSFPYDSRFPMVVEYRVEPNIVPPSRFNLFRFSPGILTSVLPRFRSWSQGQDPLAACIPNYSQGLLTPVGIPVPGGAGTQPQGKDLRGGEGGPLIEPGTFSLPVVAAAPNNGMLTIEPTEVYPLPPRLPGTSCPVEDNQPNTGIAQANVFNGPGGDNASLNEGCLISMPECRADPNVNWYRANGMLAYPLPNTAAFPGPTAVQPTAFVGYGLPLAATEQDPSRPEDECIIPFGLGGSNQAGVATNEPGMLARPSVWGDNSRYYMMWKYRKRVSIVESPTIEIPLTEDEGVMYLRPIIDPPLSAVPINANLKIELRAGPRIDFAVPDFDSGYVDILSDTFTEDVAGNGIFPRDFVKFRATFGVAPNQVLAPTLDSIVIPYVKVATP